MVDGDIIERGNATEDYAMHLAHVRVLADNGLQFPSDIAALRAVLARLDRLEAAVNRGASDELARLREQNAQLQVALQREAR